MISLLCPLLKGEDIRKNMSSLKNEDRMYQCKCKKCKTIFNFDLDDAYWDEKGYGYSTKLVRCKNCGCPNVIKHITDQNLDINNDPRFYKY